MAVYEDEAREHKEETNSDEALTPYRSRPGQEARYGQVIEDNGKSREKAHRGQSRELRSAGLRHRKADEIYQLYLKYAFRKIPSPFTPLRALYPGELVMFGWCFAFEVTNVWHSAGQLRFEDASGLALATAGLAVTMSSWPIVIEVSEKELAWHKLVFRRHVAWDEVEDVNTGMDGGLIVYLSQSRRINVSSYTEGRLELKEFICKHSKHTRNL